MDAVPQVVRHGRGAAGWRMDLLLQIRLYLGEWIFYYKLDSIGEYPTKRQVIQEEISNHGYALHNGLVLTALTANT
jgi:hypothetical protein